MVKCVRGYSKGTETLEAARHEIATALNTMNPVYLDNCEVEIPKDFFEDTIAFEENSIGRTCIQIIFSFILTPSFFALP